MGLNKDFFYLEKKRLERLNNKENVKYKLGANIVNEKKETKEKTKKGLLQEASNWKEEDWREWFEG